MNYDLLANQVTHLDDSIAGAMIVRRGELLASYARPKVPIPDREKFTRMFIQAEMMVSIPKTNADVFGNVEVVIVRHSILHIYMMPLPNKAILAFAVRADAKYDYKELLDRAFELIHSSNFVADDAIL